MQGLVSLRLSLGPSQYERLKRRLVLSPQGERSFGSG